MKGIFNPKSIAIIGASSNPQKVGHAILRNIYKGGFKGEVYPINLEGGKIFGLKVYSCIGLIKGKIDLAIIAIPAPNVPLVLEECGKKGVKNVVIISAGFREIGDKGALLEQQLLKIAQKYQITILGPNTLGFINNQLHLNASFTDIWPPKGPVAFISQSGALCSALLDLAYSKNIGFSYFISLGNELNLKEIDVIEMLAKDKNTRVIAGYLEEISDGQKFRKIIKITPTKPVILLKAGKTSKGAMAVSSHTGSLAGSYQVVKSLFSQTGVIEVDNLEDLLNLAFYFAYQKVPQRFRMGIITNAGGPGVLATDYCLKNNLELGILSAKTKKILKKYLPPAANIHNPVDIIGDADPFRYELALKALGQDKNIDLILVILTAQAMTDSLKTAEVIIKNYHRYKKPILASFMGEEKVKEAVKLLNQNHIPNFPFIQNAFSCLKKIKDYQVWQKETRPVVSYYQFSLSKKAENRLNLIFSQKGFLPIDQLYPLFKIYKFPYLKARIVKNEEEAIKAAQKLGYPLALRIVSQEIIHKTEVGGVALGINSDKELRQVFKKMYTGLKRKNLLEKVLGFELSEMTPEGVEVIIGVKKDRIGHLIMFGWGGIYTELLKDTSFRLAPLGRKEAEEMIKETKVFQILSGFRATQKYDLKIIIDCLLKVSDLVTRFPQISELDINPLRVFKKGGKIIDVKLKISG